MKKVKIMLTAFAVLAIVGGALAFKAAKFNGNLWCSTASQVNPPDTPTYSESETGSLFYCTTDKDGQTETEKRRVSLDN